MDASTISVPRSLLEQLRRALGTTVDSNVTIQGLCRIGSDCREGDTRTCFDAIGACVAVQEELVVQAVDDVGKLLGEASHG